MKVMQVNVWQGRLLRPLLDLIKAENPDIIFTQEIYSYPAVLPQTSPWSYFATLERIIAQNDYPHRYFSPSSTFSVFGEVLSFGNAIISNFPLSNGSTHYTGGAGPIHYQTTAEFSPNDTRNFQHVVANVGGTRLHLINHHAHWVNQPLGDNVSEARLRRISDYVNGLEGPVLVAGDFNLSPVSPAMSTFIAATHLRDAVEVANIPTTLSAAHYLDKPIACDYLLASPGVKINGLHAAKRLVSDHLAIVAEVTV